LREKGRKRQVEKSKNREPRAKRRETRCPGAVRFLCACLPQAGLCAFASNRKIETRSKIPAAGRYFVLEPPINFKKEKKKSA
jgi:hypothetical protein